MGNNFFVLSQFLAHKRVAGNLRTCITIIVMYFAVISITRKCFYGSHVSLLSFCLDDDM